MVPTKKLAVIAMLVAQASVSPVPLVLPVLTILLFVFRGFSLIGISVAGAVAHNLGQLAMAALILNFSGILYYLPVILLFSIPTGIITGLLVRELVRYTKATNRFGLLKES